VIWLTHSGCIVAKLQIEKMCFALISTFSKL
jgi:hypothetical protein